MDVLKTIPDHSVSCVVTDPPYPCAVKNYGVMSEEEWHSMMTIVLEECKRVIVPDGSAMFILQPNGKHVGEMRLWLYEFIIYAAKFWNLVQDVVWFNTIAMPNQWCNSKIGLLRPAIKYCVWIGNPDCYRNQQSVMLSAENMELNLHRYGIKCQGTSTRESGYTVDEKRILKKSIDNKESTPFNVIVCSTTCKRMPGDDHYMVEDGKFIHPAKTPEGVCHWWNNYICPPGGTVLDPFMGVATVGAAALKQKKNYIGIEHNEEYFNVAKKRLESLGNKYNLQS
jgi:DNA modification methylase